MFKSKRIKYAIIGVGRMGTVHAHNLYKKRVSNARLAAVCDISALALDKFAKKHPGVECYNKHEDLLNCDIDAVIIAVPHYQHLTIARDFIKAKKNIIIEKPLTVELKDAQEFCKLKKKYPDLKIAIMYNQRTNPLYAKAKELIKSGALGEIRRSNFIITNWYRPDAYYANNSWRATYCGEGGGILLNQCVHQLDILTSLLGTPVNIDSRISTINRSIKTENDVTAIMEYKNGAICSLSASGHEQNGICRLEISGDLGRLVIGKCKMVLYTYATSEIELNLSTLSGYGRSKKQAKHYRYGILRLIRDSIYGQQIRIIDNFTKSLLNGADLIADANEGINALEIINGIYLSSWCEKKISLPLDNNLFSKMLEGKRNEEKTYILKR